MHRLRVYPVFIDEPRGTQRATPLLEFRLQAAFYDISQSRPAKARHPTVACWKSAFRRLLTNPRLRSSARFQRTAAQRKRAGSSASKDSVKVYFSPSPQSRSPVRKSSHRQDPARQACRNRVDRTIQARNARPGPHRSLARTPGTTNETRGWRSSSGLVMSDHPSSTQYESELMTSPLEIVPSATQV